MRPRGEITLDRRADARWLLSANAIAMLALGHLPGAADGPLRARHRRLDVSVAKPPEPTATSPKRPVSSQLAYDGGLLKVQPRRGAPARRARSPGASTWCIPGAVMMLAFVDDEHDPPRAPVPLPQGAPLHRAARRQARAGRAAAGDREARADRGVRLRGRRVVEDRHARPLHRLLQRGDRALRRARPHARGREARRGRAPARPSRRSIADALEWVARRYHHRHEDHLRPALVGTSSGRDERGRDRPARHRRRHQRRRASPATRPAAG